MPGSTDGSLQDIRLLKTSYKINNSHLNILCYCLTILVAVDYSELCSLFNGPSLKISLHFTLNFSDFKSLILSSFHVRFLSI